MHQILARSKQALRTTRLGHRSTFPAGKFSATSWGSAVMAWGALACLPASPCHGQLQLITSQATAGSNHSVYTKHTGNIPGLLFDLLSATYYLQGSAQAGNSHDDYKTFQKDKLLEILLPSGGYIVSGWEETETAKAFGDGYLVTGESSIETNPIDVFGHIGTTVGGIETGVQANLKVQAVVAPVDPYLKGYTHAEAAVYDPFVFHDFAPDDALHLTSVLPQGDAFSLQGETGSLLRSLVVSTDIPGLETLYRLDIMGTGTGLFTGTDQDTEVAVHFASSPVLGLSDADVAASVQNALSFDAAARQFALTSDVTLFDGFVEIPDSVQDFRLSIVESVIVSNEALPAAPSVPEPSPLLLLGASGMSLFFWLRSARRH